MKLQHAGRQIIEYRRRPGATASRYKVAPSHESRTSWPPTPEPNRRPIRASIPRRCARLPAWRSMPGAWRISKQQRAEILSVDRERVLARVAGTRDWRVELRGGGRDFDGACDCPAFEDAGFCKHLVAVALTANAADGGSRSQACPSALERITSYLRGLSVEALTGILARGNAERDKRRCSSAWKTPTLSVEGRR